MPSSPAASSAAMSAPSTSGSTHPVWMPHGTRGDFGDFSEVGVVAARPNWQVQPFATGALPHFEQPDEFLAAYEKFLAGAPG